MGRGLNAGELVVAGTTPWVAGRELGCEEGWLVALDESPPLFIQKSTESLSAVVRGWPF